MQQGTSESTNINDKSNPLLWQNTVSSFQETANNDPFWATVIATATDDTHSGCGERRVVVEGGQDGLR